MAASQEDLTRWFNMGREAGCTHMIVMCDTYDWDDYPVWIGESTPWGINSGREFWEVYDEQVVKPMQRVMEVYDLTASLGAQMAEHRAHHAPPRPTRDEIAP